VSFLNINEDDRKNLIALSQQNKVVVGPGCIKYRMQSPEFRIDTTTDKHNLIMAWARVFSEYLVYRSGYQMGVEIKEKRPQFITFFYLLRRGGTRRYLGRVPEQGPSRLLEA